MFIEFKNKKDKKSKVKVKELYTGWVFVHPEHFTPCVVLLDEFNSEEVGQTILAIDEDGDIFTDLSPETEVILLAKSSDICVKY